jgi:hypothetical protein
LLPVMTGYSPLPVNATNPVMRGTPFASYTYSLDWNFRLTRSGTLNDDGFIAAWPYGSAGHKVLLVGNSFVAADAIDPERNLAGVLSKSLDAHRVLALGHSGAALADYLALADWGCQRYHPDAVLFLLVEGDILRSYGLRIGGYGFLERRGALEYRRLDWAPRGGAAAVIKKSKVFWYFAANLRLASTLPKLRLIAAQQDTRTAPEDATRIGRASVFALARLQEIAPKSRFLFLVDAKRVPGIGERDIDRFADIAEQQGWSVLRLQDAFDRYQQATGLRLDFKR